MIDLRELSKGLIICLINVVDYIDDDSYDLCYKIMY